MKKVIIGTVLLLTTTLSVFSQTKNITVAGRVIEDDTKEPAVQATVQLLSLPDSAFAAGIATTAQGYFTQSKGWEVCIESFLYRLPTDNASFATVGSKPQ